MRRSMKNTLSVVALTALTALAIYTGVQTTGRILGVGSTAATAGTQTAYANAGASAGTGVQPGVVQTCPRTGCSATSCHATDGTGIPRR